MLLRRFALLTNWLVVHNLWIILHSLVIIRVSDRLQIVVVIVVVNVWLVGVSQLLMVDIVINRLSREAILNQLILFSLASHIQSIRLLDTRGRLREARLAGTFTDVPVRVTLRILFTHVDVKRLLQTSIELSETLLILLVQEDSFNVAIFVEVSIELVEKLWLNIAALHLWCTTIAIV